MAMNDTISRQAALDAMCDNCATVEAVCPHYPCHRYMAVESLPSAERKGKWKVYYHGGTNFSYSCDQCLAQAPFLWNSKEQMKTRYCHNCGAKMDYNTIEDELRAYNKAKLSSLYGKCVTDGEEI